MSSLEIKNLRKSSGPVEVLKDINLSADSGEFVALVGPSGCGKSTLLSIIAGLTQLTSGEVRIEDRVVNDAAPKDRDIAMVFQSYALYPTMTVRQNMTFGMECRHIPKAEQTRTVARVAALLQIQHLLDRKPGQLSSGQRQRVAMGRALARDPKVFLFDEPLSNLDAKLRVEMRTEIKKLHKSVGKKTVYVTHDQIEAMTLATRIAVMHQSTLQQYDAPKAIYETPKNLFVAGFMGSPNMNFFSARVRGTGEAAMIVLDGDGCPPLPAAARQRPPMWPARRRPGDHPRRASRAFQPRARPARRARWGNVRGPARGDRDGRTDRVGDHFDGEDQRPGCYCHLRTRRSARTKRLAPAK